MKFIYTDLNKYISILNPNGESIAKALRIKEFAKHVTRGWQLGCNYHADEVIMLLSVSEEQDEMEMFHNNLW